MDLKRLRRIVDDLIEQEGEDSPVAVFYVTATDVNETLDFLRSSGKIKSNFQPRIKDVLTELQYNAGNPPYEDLLTDELEDLLIHWEDDPEE